MFEPDSGNHHFKVIDSLQAWLFIVTMHTDTGPFLSKAPPRKTDSLSFLVRQTVPGTAEVMEENLLVARNGRGCNLAVNEAYFLQA